MTRCADVAVDRRRSAARSRTQGRAPPPPVGDHGGVTDDVSHRPAARADDPERPEAWQIGLITLVGGAILLVLGLFGLEVLVAAWWVAATAVWGVRLALPDGPVRAAAVGRGPVLTVLWAPLVGPYALGAAVTSLTELVA